MKNIVFIDGKFLPYDRVNIPLSTHAFNYGTGCFEGIRGYWNQERQKLFVFRPHDHFIRLKKSCKTLRMDLKWSLDELVEITINLVKKNTPKENIYIRPIVFKSSPEVTNFVLEDLTTSFAIYSLPLGKMHNTSRGIKVTISHWLRQDSRMIPPEAKPTGIYLNTALAKTEAHDRNVAEAILLNSDGSVAEASAANIFLVTKKGLVTPSVDQNILNGITRQTVIEIAKNEYGLRTVERKVSKNELFSADEIFISGTGVEITPVTQIDKTKIGLGTVGKTTKKIQDLYFSIVRGENKNYEKWLTTI